MIAVSDNLAQRISLALNTEDVSILSKLMSDVSVRVRRAVARNRFTPSSVLEVLIEDPVLNVSFMASQNKNCQKKRIIDRDLDHPCVSCKAKENNMDCDRCVKLKKFNTKG